MTELRIGGLSRLSSCDWEGQLVATVFCQGCSWRCPYCHNPELRSATAENPIPWDVICSFLEMRRGLLDGVVFSGGEPLLQSALSDAMQDVRQMGFMVGLHTGGSAPERFAEVLPLTDWVGFDVKAPFDDYGEVNGVDGSGAPARESLGLLLQSGVAYEIRTTVHPRVLDGEALLRMANALAGLGVSRWVLQRFRPREGVDLPAENYEQDVLAGLEGLQIIWR